MLSIRNCTQLASQALRRNRLQTGLAILGMTVGVGALVTSIGLGRGAQQAIDAQLRAAGVTVIVVKAGNFMKGAGNVGTRSAKGGSSALGFGSDAGDHSMIFHSHAESGGLAAGLIRTSWSQAEPPPGDRMSDPARTQAAYDSLVFYSNGRALRQGDFLPVHFGDDPLSKSILPTNTARPGDSVPGRGPAYTLTRADADAIRQIAGVSHVASSLEDDATLQTADGTKSWFTDLRGTSAALQQIRTGWTFPYGRFLDATEVQQAQHVVVLGRVVSDQLFGHDVNPVGRTVLLWHLPFHVVGVLGSHSWAARPAAGDHQFDAIYIPVTTAQRILGLNYLSGITLTTDTVGETTTVARKVVDLLRKRHHITEVMPDDFTVRTQAQLAIGNGLPPALARVIAGNISSVDQLTVGRLAASLRRASRTMMSLLAGVAAVALLVGGIGIMNVLLLSVTERTREIGLRMAVGAKHGDVVAQFVSEAVLLSVVGGLLGTLVGALASGSLERFFSYSVDISAGSVVLAVSVAAVLGVVFGVYPATRAARLDPISALRYE